MATKKFLDLTLKDMADAVLFLIENPDSPDDFAKVNGTKILTWLADSGYLTQTEIETLLSTGSYIQESNLNTLIEALNYISTNDLAANQLIASSGILDWRTIRNILPADFITDFELIGSGSPFANEFDLNLIGNRFDCTDSTNATVLSLTSDLINQTVDGGASSTQYYVFLTLTGTTYAIKSDDNADGTNLTDDYFRLIGFYVTDPAGELSYSWKITEKWKDESFDLASNAKDTSLDANSPDFSDLFASGIKLAVFPTGADRWVDMRKKYSRSGKVDGMIQFYADTYVEDATSGNITLFVDYWITNEGDSNIASSGTRLMKTFTAPGAIGEHKTVSFGFITPSPDTLKAGTEIHFRFGRLGDHASDTYAADVAIGTVGFHYISTKRGSDLLTTNI